MTTEQAHKFLNANYPEKLVQQYIAEVLHQYATEEEYWTLHITTEEKLRHDMDLFVEALS